VGLFFSPVTTRGIQEYDDDDDDDDDDDNKNVTKKEAEKILKYEIPYNRNTTHVEHKNKVAPVIIGANGTISKSFRKYLSSVPGKHDIKDLQKTAILGTAHKLRKVLM
jgi:hypothetical protein